MRGVQRPSWHVQPRRRDHGSQLSRYPCQGLGLAGCESPTTLAAASPEEAGSHIGPQALCTRDDPPTPLRRPCAGIPWINIVHPHLVSLVL
jgi:hypothetical protein